MGGTCPPISLESQEFLEIASGELLVVGENSEQQALILTIPNMGEPSPVPLLPLENEATTEVFDISADGSLLEAVPVRGKRHYGIETTQLSQSLSEASLGILPVTTS